MKFRTLLLAVITLLSSGYEALAQKETAHHRATYNAINEATGSMKKVTAVYKDEPTEFALTGWLQDGEVRKIVALNGDDGNGVEEYYLENEQPLFVFNTYTSSGAKIEERLYFKDGEIFKWLTTEKPAPVFHGEDYAANTERLTTNTAAFVTALKKAAGKGASKAKGQAATKVVEGTFAGIEEGDYAHWSMRTKGGEELSFFILSPNASVDKVLENPDKYVGKKCRVTVKQSTENIPEAGGKMEVEQVLSVEWSGK